MTVFYVELRQTQNGRTIARFKDAQAFMDFIREHAAELDSNTAVVSDSAETKHTCDSFIDSEVEKVQVLSHAS